MILVVGFDLSVHGDQALLDASEALALDEGGRKSLHVVHVVDQKGLDATGQLSADRKREVAIERGYPLVWRRVKDLAQRMPFGLPDDVVVDVGVAAVHAVRTHEEIARRLLRVAGDFDASAIVLGRQGRPGSVVEHVRALAGLIDGDKPEGATSLFLRSRDGAPAIAKSQVWSAEGTLED